MGRGKKEKVYKICLECGKRFLANRRNKVYCCTHCGDKYRYRLHGGTTRTKQKKKAEENIVRRRPKDDKFNALAKMQNETGIGAGYLSIFWNDKAALAAYVAVHRTR